MDTATQHDKMIQKWIYSISNLLSKHCCKQCCKHLIISLERRSSPSTHTDAAIKFYGTIMALCLRFKESEIIRIWWLFGPIWYINILSDQRPEEGQTQPEQVAASHLQEGILLGKLLVTLLVPVLGNCACHRGCHAGKNLQETSVPCNANAAQIHKQCCLQCI